MFVLHTRYDKKLPNDENLTRTFSQKNNNICNRIFNSSLAATAVTA
jgi:hypothetical protein